MEVKTEKLPYPKAVGFIVANEFCERFSYYGLRTILSLYLRDMLGYSDDGATVIYHSFTMLAYFFPVIGAMIADGWLGRYRTILYLSSVYACGSFLISITAIPPLHLPGLSLTLLALLLVAIGTGGIKPCVSAFGGDQFKLPEQEKYLGYFFSIFYFSINAGSLISTFFTPMLRAEVSCFGQDTCYSLAFGVPGILMVISVVFFALGHYMYIVKNPSGNIIGQVCSCIGHATVKSCKSKEKREHWLDHADDKYDRNLIEDIKCLLRVLVLFIPLPIFWALFDQQGSRWTFQADRMRQDIGSWTLQADQMQVLNPLLILIFIPLCQIAIYPFLEWCKIIRRPLHKMIMGGFLAATAFVISGVVELNLLPTYGTPLSEGLGQLRVYNGFNCNFKLNISDGLTKEIHMTTIPPLSVYENLDIPVKNSVEIPYNIKGDTGTACEKIVYSGNFHVVEKGYTSLFISSNDLISFVDDNDKAMNGVKIRFLSNLNSVATIRVDDANKNVTRLSIRSNDMEQKQIQKGKYDIWVDKTRVISDYNFEAGAVFAINVYEDSTRAYWANPVMITPENSVHILWLVPQYIIITLGEVMFSVTGLEFSFTQAPASMKSVLQAMWLLTVAFGNLVVILVVEGHILNAQWKEFFLFAGLMAIDMLIFTSMTFRYKYVALKSSTEDLTVEEIILPDKPRQE
ncbi:peptide transporter family 1 isoform X2 [Hyposmocoma kahamanoa]|uniref:peptide transporter family 1 isoform X2 n=1 Tax=Hyposmocoma kahamanoa TaxID=1477025 RepID=UPI000E6D658C|nr:peptide transporter family 1 isoform X2 [Hyposmocoma kahamanoa]